MPPKGSKQTDTRRESGRVLGSGDRSPGTPKVKERMPTEEIHKQVRDCIQEAIKDILPSLNETIQKTIKHSFSQIQQEVTAQASRIEELEQRIGVMEDEIGSLHTSIEVLNKDNKWLKNKMDDMENRTRRNNIRLIGLPESIPQQRLRETIMCDISKALGMTEEIKVERAHRIGPFNQERTNPRPVIAKILDFHDKVRLVTAYKKASSLEIDGHKILLFADYSAETATKRRIFSPICSKLFDKKIKFFLTFPATLKVENRKGTMRSFTNHDEAKEFLKKEWDIDD